MRIPCNRVSNQLKYFISFSEALSVVYSKPLRISIGCHINKVMSAHGHNANIVTIKEEWDYAPHINDFLNDHKRNSNSDKNKRILPNCHVTRAKEQELLMDFFRRRVEGALLVSGKRGVGKTSAINSAIKVADGILNKQTPDGILNKQTPDGILNKQTPDESKELLPVLINAPNFEIRKSQLNKDIKPERVNFIDFKRLVMQNLVRGLYQAAEKHGIIDKSSVNYRGGKKSNIFSWKTSEDKNTANTLQISKLLEPEKVALKNGISNLFMRAVAKKVTEESQLNESTLQNYLLKKEASFQMDWKMAAKSIGVSISLGLAAAFYLPLTGMPTILSQIAPILISVAPPSIVMSWQITKTISNENKAERKASIIYLFDYDLSTLQSELEEALRELTHHHYKVIFVIDELDKIDETDVVEVIKSLKPLLNQASALFVLISGQEFFDMIHELDNVRGKEYTLFSQRIFLQRPQFDEMKKFMDKIVNLNDESQAILRLFKWNEIKGTEKIEDFLKEKDVDYGALKDIKGAKITRDGDNLKITVEDGNGPNDMIKGKDYSVLIKKQELAQDSVLAIPLQNDRPVEYNFNLMDYGVYTRSQQYRDFQYYAMYASRCDFFDLYNILRDNIFYYENDGRPRLKIELDDEQKRQVELQKIIEDFYPKKAYSHPSRWNDNDHLLTLIYDLITKFHELRGKAIEIRIARKPIFKIVFVDDKGENVGEVPPPPPPPPPVPPPDSKNQ